MNKIRSVINIEFAGSRGCRKRDFDTRPLTLQVILPLLRPFATQKMSKTIDMMPEHLPRSSVRAKTRRGSGIEDPAALLPLPHPGSLPLPSKTAVNRAGFEPTQLSLSELESDALTTRPSVHYKVLVSLDASVCLRSGTTVCLETLGRAFLSPLSCPGLVVDAPIFCCGGWSAGEDGKGVIPRPSALRLPRWAIATLRSRCYRAELARSF